MYLSNIQFRNISNIYLFALSALEISIYLPHTLTHTEATQYIHKQTGKTQQTNGNKNSIESDSLSLYRHRKMFWLLVALQLVVHITDVDAIAVCVFEFYKYESIFGSALFYSMLLEISIYRQKTAHHFHDLHRVYSQLIGRRHLPPPSTIAITLVIFHSCPVFTVVACLCSIVCVFVCVSVALWIIFQWI